MEDAVINSIALSRRAQARGSSFPLSARSSTTREDEELRCSQFFLEIFLLGELSPSLSIHRFPFVSLAVYRIAAVYSQAVSSSSVSPQARFFLHFEAQHRTSSDSGTRIDWRRSWVTSRRWRALLKAIGEFCRSSLVLPSRESVFLASKSAATSPLR